MKLLGAAEFILNKLLSLLHLSKSKPSPGLIMTNPAHVFTMFASNEGCLKENSSKQLLSITMAEGRHLCLAVKYLSFTLGVNTKH